MPEEKEDKGFKVIDRRGREEPPPSPPLKENPPPAATEEGNPPSPPLKENPPPAATEGKAPEDSGASPPKQTQKDFPPASALGVPRFLDLVQSLQMGAMVGLGMFQGPDGKRPPVDLPAAKDAIDLLGILQEKTKGNLTKEEEEVLREGLYHLRMGYMAMINAPPAGRKKEGDQR
ncbi:DUF1844 domain-containing protein [Candidatus Deferrimicrobium sp.]|uniref:DUF1844 domain-containing protein n=1 Tax=Candidatus Deferrimicrobium sp. TaxID=3060586 RepID=UPI003C4B2296